MTTVPHPLLAYAPDGRVQCDVCPRACKLRDGQRGLCYVRAREGGGVVLTSYGRSSGFCVDPIEEKAFIRSLPGPPVARLAPPAAISPAGSARTGTSPSRATSTRSRTGLARGDRRRRGRARLRERRVHLQRPGHLP